MVNQNKHEGEIEATKTMSSSKQVELLKTPVVPVRSDITDTSPTVDYDDGQMMKRRHLPKAPQQQDSIAIRRSRREFEACSFTDIVAYALPVIEDDIPSAYKEAVRSSESWSGRNLWMRR
ncbi:exocyst subunit exo70 family protein F1 [Prunus dulcis]|uniref:Exocyst subunit exo70 family protein F1 n=1 Tax=Prunus dulcis TaxID=3755 RepID=A0A5H2XM91_PRUDU|nr:exocyst subunit exo70 family protein F1 [Prunus dulcis]